jgi:Zn-dependent metalloprotease
LFNRFTGLDIVAKEFGNGVVGASSKLEYWGQSGSLYNSIATVFAALVKQYALHQTAYQADWLVGEALFPSAVKARAQVSLADPGTAYDDPTLGKDPQCQRRLEMSPCAQNRNVTAMLR